MLASRHGGWFTFWVILLPFPAALSAPYAPEPRRIRGRVPHRMPDIPVPQIILNQPGVRPVISQRITTGMPQHVRVRAYRDVGCLAEAGEKVIELLTGKRTTGAGDEEPVIAGVGHFFTHAQPGPQGADFPGDEGMNGGEAVLEAGDMDLAAVEVDIGEAQAEEFGDTEAVEEGHEDEAVVTFGVGTAEGGIKQQADLFGGEEFTFLHRGTP